ncbi:MAG: hypothetical protein PHV74_13985 [Dehalococcoidia bacterium]|nr:hypothetical protein [Dehalococcoidia bacterium]
MKKLALSCLLAFLWPTLALATPLADCAKDTLDTAIADTTTYPNGSTIELPSCEETTWADWVTVDRALTIKGQTTTSRNASTYVVTATDSTIITGKGFTVSADNVVITGITFQNMTIANPNAVIITPVAGYTNLDIYGNHFDNCNARLVTQKRDNSGLRFYRNLVTQPGYETLYIIGAGKTSWDIGGSCGSSSTSKTSWIEDNEFRLTTATQTNIIDADEGARVVIRGNLFTGSATYSISSNVIESHGHCYTYRDMDTNWGTYCLEVYDNKFANPADPSFGGQGIVEPRGGRSYVYKNTVSNTGWYPYYIVGFMDNQVDVACNLTACANQDHEDGGYHAVPISGDPNFGGTPLLCTTYPCPMQVNNSYVFGNTFTERPGYQGGHRRDYSGADQYANFIQIDRDWWSDYYEGSAHNTYGEGTSLPETCTTHALYWHTGTQTLSRCTATDTWTAVYSAYTYPNPSRLDLGPDETAPTFGSGNIDVNGVVLTVNFAETVSEGAGYADGDWTLACSVTEGLTVAHGTGDGTSTWAFDITGGPIQANEVCTIDWAGTANGVEDGSGNDLAAFDPAKSLTNGSLEGAAGPWIVTSPTISGNGCTVYPPLTTQVADGNPFELLRTVTSGYHVESYTEDTCGGTWTGNIYNITSIEADCSMGTLTCRTDNGSATLVPTGTAGAGSITIQ